MTCIVPHMALSVRQPWAFALAMGWKDIENRNWRQPNPGLRFRGAVAIHASSGMTRREYDHAAAFFRDLGFACPLPHELVRGGIIGLATITGILKKSNSPWYSGRIGLVFARPQLIEPIPAVGQLGFFQWKRSGDFAAPAKWMLPKPNMAESVLL